MTLRTETETTRSTNEPGGFQPALLTQLGIGLVLLGQVLHILLQLHLLGRQVLLELLEEQQTPAASFETALVSQRSDGS